MDLETLTVNTGPIKIKSIFVEKFRTQYLDLGTCNLEVYFNSFREIPSVEFEDERCLEGAGLRVVQGEAPAAELQTKVCEGEDFTITYFV